MQHRSKMTRAVMATVCALACAQSMQAGFFSTTIQWAGSLWSWEPTKIMRYTATGAATGAVVVSGYFAYNGGLQGNLFKVLCGGILGGGCGFVLSQLYGVRASVKKIEGIVEELREHMGQLTQNVREGFEKVQASLSRISQALKQCATFEALERVKQELMAFIQMHAQSQEEKTRRQLDDVERRLQAVVSSDHDALTRIEQMMHSLLAKNNTPSVVVNVSSTSSNRNSTENSCTCVNKNDNHSTINNANNNSNYSAPQQKNMMTQNNIKSSSHKITEYN
jgi:hypothetical protein